MKKVFLFLTMLLFAFTGTMKAQSLTAQAGTDYSVTASTDAEFPVSIETRDLPAPDQAVVIAPSDGETNVVAPYTASWTLGEYTAEMQVLVGTQYPPQTALIDWTSELVYEATLSNLKPNQSYFMQVNARNFTGTTYGEIVAFITPIDTVQNFAAEKTELYPGDAAVFTWDANRTLQGYNIYMDGVKINESVITTNTYTVEDLTYNMTGYNFQITAVYDAAESDKSTAVNVKMTGNGTVNGHVYDTDEDHPIAFATIELRGTDEYGAEQVIPATADENAAYTCEVLAGNFTPYIVMTGYAEVPGTAVAVAYEGIYDDVDIFAHEFYYPLKKITAALQEDNTVLVEWTLGSSSNDVTVILTAPDAWGDGSGYQMLLDDTHSLYGTTIPTTGALSSNCEGNEGIYDQFSHKIPTDADGNCSTQNMVNSASVTITIPAGTYDWCITNPTPGDKIWIAADNGNVGGRQDDYVFEAGNTYEFVVSRYDLNDGVDVTITGGAKNTANASESDKTYANIDCKVADPAMLANIVEAPIKKIDMRKDGVNRSINHYILYRGNVYDSTVVLINDNIALDVMSHVDMDWEGLPFGMYEWGVQAYYEGYAPERGDGLSEIIWSNVIDKDMETTLTFNVTTDNGQAPVGATIAIEGDNTYNVAIGETGSATQVIRKGNYVMTATFAGYTTTWSFDGEITSNATYDIEFIETIAPVEDLYVSPTGWVMWNGSMPTPTPGEGEWYYYDNGTFDDAIGTNGGNFWWAVMFPAGSYEGNAVTKVSTYDYMAMTGNVTIYNDGATAPATAVGTADVTLTGSADFVEVEFAEPVIIDPSKNLWIVYYNGSGATHPATACANTGDANGRWVSTDGTSWGDVASYGLDNTFMIRAYVATANKGEVVEISAPQGNGSNGTLAKAGVAKANRGDRAPISYKVMLDGNDVGETTSPFYQHDVEGMEEGSEHVTSVAPVYVNGMGDWVEYTWTYTSCSNFAGVTGFTSTVEGNTVTLNWTLPSASAKSDNRDMWDLITTFNAPEASHYGVVTDGEYIYTSNWGYSGATHNFYKYDMEGNVIEGFEIPGCGTLRGMTFDGEYVYGVANSSTIYCVDLNNHTLVAQTTSAYGAMRGITYDAERDGFWVIGNWSGNLTLVDRSGAIVQVGPAPTSASDLAYYKDADGVEHVFCFNNGTNDVDDYNIATNTITSAVFNFNSTPGYASGSSGGCHVATYAGKTAFFGDIQESPNLIGIYELDGNAPEPPAEDILGVVLFRNDEFVGVFNAKTKTFVDEGLEPGHYDYTIRVVYDGAPDVTYYAMSCGDETGADVIDGVTENDDVINSIYPNPTSGDLYITATAMKHITVFNTMGQMVFSLDVNTDEYVLNMGKYEAGVYMIKIDTANGSSVKRINVVK